MKANKKQQKNFKRRLQIKTIINAVLFVICFIALTTGLKAQDDALFKKNCGVCHTVGKGLLVGPDLAGVTSKRSEEWLMKWIKSSQTLVKSGDADAKAICDQFNGMVMPDVTIPDSEIKDILAYIGSKSAPVAGAAPDTTKKVAAPDASNNATAEQIEMGKNIFLGSHALANGGPACISCHNVNYEGVIPGGLLAKDLTTVYGRLGGDAGLQGMLGAPPFPAMTEAYKNRPITDIEIAALTAFFNKVDKDKANQVTSAMNPLLNGGVIGLVVILVMIFIIWWKRKSSTVKKDIYKRQIKSTDITGI